MYRVVVITDPETATGFRLAGVEVREVTTPQQTLEQVRSMLTQDYGVVAINEDLMKGLDEDVTRLMRGRETPIIVPFPAPKAQLESGEEYIARLVKAHIGFFVKLR